MFYFKFDVTIDVSKAGVGIMEKCKLTGASLHLHEIHLDRDQHVEIGGFAECYGRQGESES